MSDCQSCPGLERRTVLAAGLAVTVGGLAGCTAYGAGPPAPPPPSAVPDTSETAPLARTEDVPLGGGLIVEAAQVVITQPTAGEFKAFSAVCTHQGCLVSEVAEAITCACHGSSFSVTDGSVTGGPAPTPLAARALSVDGDAITLA